MKILIGLIALSLQAQAEPIVNQSEGVSGTDTSQTTAKSFYYEYEKGYELVLLPDECTDPHLTEDVGSSDKIHSWNAKVVDLGNKSEATGCWQYVQNNHVLALISNGNQYFDYQYSVKKFKPRF